MLVIAFFVDVTSLVAIFGSRTTVIGLIDALTTSFQLSVDGFNFKCPLNEFLSKGFKFISPVT